MTPHNREKSSLIDRLQVVADTVAHDPTVLNDENREKLTWMTKRLAAPRNVVIAGAVGSEHGLLAEFIAGRDLFSSINDIDACPPIRIRYGNEAQTSALTGATRVAFPGCNIEAATTVDKVAMIDLEIPSVSLSHFSIVLSPSFGTNEQSTHQLFQLVKSSEVVVWCSNANQPWSAEESRLWQNIPDRQKDHSILVLTAADHITTEADQQAFEEKCEDASEHFSAMVAVSVAAARAAAPDGQVHCAKSFASSGGQGIVSEIMEQTKDYDQELVANATRFLTELETLQEIAAERKQMPVVALDDDEYDDLTLEGEEETAEEEISTIPQVAPTRDEIRTKILTNIDTCKEAVLAAETGAYAPAFQGIVDILRDLGDSLKAGLKLQTEHHQMAIQIKEAEDLVGLLSYECDDKAMGEAAEILRQVCVDFWSRVALDEGDEETADIDNSAADDFDAEADQVAV